MCFFAHIYSIYSMHHHQSPSLTSWTYLLLFPCNCSKSLLQSNLVYFMFHTLCVMYSAIVTVCWYMLLLAHFKRSEADDSIFYAGLKTVPTIFFSRHLSLHSRQIRLGTSWNSSKISWNTWNGSKAQLDVD